MEGCVDMSNTQKLSRQQRNQVNRRRLAGFTFLWLVSLAFVYVGHRYLWSGAASITVAVVFVNVIIGAAMLWANKKMLCGLDELEQKVQLEAMALSLGIGLVAGFAYSALSQTGVIPFSPQISHLAVLMSVTYLVGTIKGVKKYQ